MANEILVSIFCYIYNHEKYLRKCFDGFVSQKTDFKYEIIVHDDASTDSSAEIIKEYVDKYPDIFFPIYEKENQYSQGLSFLHKMYNLSKGKYIAICEGDDFWIDENKLQTQVDFLEKHNDFSASTHNEIVVDINGNPYDDSKQKIYREKTDRIISADYIYNYCKVAHTASFLYRSSLFKEMTSDCFDEYTKVKANGDMKMSAIFLANGKVYHIAKDMACYRFVNTGTDSWSSKNNGMNLCLHTCVQLENIKEFIKKYYNTNLDYSGYYKKRAYESIRLFLKNPSKENYNIMKKTKRLAHYNIFSFIRDCIIKTGNKFKKICLKNKN